MRVSGIGGLLRVGVDGGYVVPAGHVVAGHGLPRVRVSPSRTPGGAELPTAHWAVRVDGDILGRAFDRGLAFAVTSLAYRSHRARSPGTWSRPVSVRSRRTCSGSASATSGEMTIHPWERRRAAAVSSPRRRTAAVAAAVFGRFGAGISTPSGRHRWRPSRGTVRCRRSSRVPGTPGTRTPRRVGPWP